jgi:monooxygenase
MTPIDQSTESPSHVDVLIVGAGLSGIGAAVHLQTGFPEKSYAILESRGTSGGTWDLFKYPGIRSDSDMHTLGYRFKVWEDEKTIADGPSILSYVRETAAEHGINEQIRYHHRVVRAEWSTADALWTIEATRTDTGETVELTSSFLFCCGGYYDYEQGYTPTFPGRDRFKGEIVHPQQWPEDLDYSGKRVVVIGSGATAVTLVPSLARTAEHVTMLQRSPTYIVSQPETDALNTNLRKVLPHSTAYAITRWKNALRAILIYELSQRRPKFVKDLLRKGVIRQLPDGYDVDTHFNPKYNPWDQRLCLVPRGDLFRSIRDGKASVVTDHIDTFTETGIKLASGEELEADIIVTATGLNLLTFGGIQLVVDGDEIALPDTTAYKGMMLSGVPNFAFAIGYTNASWTLKVDLVCDYLNRLFAYMDEHGYKQCVPVEPADLDTDGPLIDFQSGYVLRSAATLPRQGAKEPWRLRQNYVRDLVSLRHGKIDDGAMGFSSPPVAATTAEKSLAG